MSPAPPGIETPAASYAAATHTLRTTARWLVTAAAGVGGALVAGLQLTGIGSLGAAEWLRLLLAVLGLVAALVAIGYMVLRASQILTDEWITLAQLDLDRFHQRLRAGSLNKQDRKRAEILTGLYDEIEIIKDELFAEIAPDVSDLYHQLQRANEAARRDPLSELGQRASTLREAAGAVVEFANFYITRESLKRLRRQLAWGSAVVATGVLVFAYAANPPKPATAPVKPTQRTTLSPTPTTPAPPPHRPRPTRT